MVGKRIVALGLFLAALLAAAAPAAAAPWYVLRFNHVLGPNHPITTPLGLGQAR